ncbi:uncharacterized protein LY79DRAFT_51246 [Colletotrichum navitas]|uniref:Uncharacterized protein n=1 Tax=Colletotrichum navitas TaxID=681940 RepID=A0AAD8V9N1_9PEZI|nr:uncharacterized protein LY79DRAFT_51246 [Colletotrichum navitas]KAK1596690.1 hypothetical protein LY79DRAFT_51246 [Colletotrichum navitas]
MSATAKAIYKIKKRPSLGPLWRPSTRFDKGKEKWLFFFLSASRKREGGGPASAFPTIPTFSLCLPVEPGPPLCQIRPPASIFTLRGRRRERREAGKGGGGRAGGAYVFVAQINGYSEEKCGGQGMYVCVCCPAVKNGEGPNRLEPDRVWMRRRRRRQRQQRHTTGHSL